MNPSPAPALPSVPEPLAGPRRSRPGRPLGLEPLGRRALEAAGARSVGAHPQSLAYPADDRADKTGGVRRGRGVPGAAPSPRRRARADAQRSLLVCRDLPEHAAGAPLPSPLLGEIAYFSMEFGLTEALPIYSGGLGILAGDYLKAASDLGVPVVGIGILWQQGYFRQALSASGEQIEFFPFNDPGQLPIAPLRDSRGEWVQRRPQLPAGGRFTCGSGRSAPGRVRLYLLDANDLHEQRRRQGHHQRALRRRPGDKAAAGDHPRHRRLAGAARARHRGGDLPSERGPRRFRGPRTGPLLHGRQRGRRSKRP